MSDIIALDVSKGHSYCVVYHHNECIAEFDCLHNKVGFKKLKQVIDEATMPTVYFEATGVYSRPLVKFCQDYHVSYSLLNPLEVSINTQQLRRMKSDTSDAHKIAHAAMINDYRQTTNWTPLYQKLRELSRFYSQIEKEVILNEEKIDTALDQTFPEEENLFSARYSKLAINVVLLYPHPDLLKNMSRTKISNQLMKQTDKRLSKTKATGYAEKLLKFAEISYPAADVDSVQVEKVRYYCRQLITLITFKEQLLKKMISVAEQIPEFKIFCSVPGIGPQSAAQLLGELGDIRRFDKASQLNAYVGTDLKHYQSGQTQYQDHINKRGNSHARSLMYIIVGNMIRQQRIAPNHVVDFYYKLKKQPIHPKKDKVARVACINKTLKCLYTMVMAGNDSRYSYSDSKSPNTSRK